MKAIALGVALLAAPAYAGGDTQQQALQAQAQEAQIQELYRERNDARSAADYWQAAAMEARAQLAQAQSEITKLQAQAKGQQK